MRSATLASRRIWAAKITNDRMTTEDIVRRNAREKLEALRTGLAVS